MWALNKGNNTNYTLQFLSQNYSYTVNAEVDQHPLCTSWTAGARFCGTCVHANAQPTASKQRMKPKLQGYLLTPTLGFLTSCRCQVRSGTQETTSGYCCSKCLQVGCHSYHPTDIIKNEILLQSLNSTRDVSYCLPPPAQGPFKHMLFHRDLESRPFDPKI